MTILVTYAIFIHFQSTLKRVTFVYLVISKQILLQYTRPEAGDEFRCKMKLYHVVHVCTMANVCVCKVR
jgi:hypothetical protein